jgi:hypothetical protein
MKKRRITNLEGFLKIEKTREIGYYTTPSPSLWVTLIVQPPWHFSRLGEVVFSDL